MSKEEIQKVLDATEIADTLTDGVIKVADDKGYSVAYYPGTEEPRSILPLGDEKPTITWLS